MAHALQDRYSKMVLAKLRQELVLKDGVVFNNDYEGSPKAGSVKIPVRDTEVTVSDYNKATGATIGTGTTSYETMTISKDKSVNEVIDGYDAQAVPDGIVAERLDSAAYSLAKQIDTDGGVTLLAGATNTYMGSSTTITKSNIYEKVIVPARTALSKNNVPNDERYILVTPDTMALIIQAPEFIRASDLGDEVIEKGAIGKIAGMLVIEWNTSTTNLLAVAGHPKFATRATEFAVDVHLQDLNGSGNYIGASAVQGRKVYDHKVLRATAVQAFYSGAEPT
ncbi:MAG: hypothetical protein R3Y33_04525 [Clostridia bacterium]